MNLALHGFLLQVFLSILNFKDGFKLCSAGEPGYLDFDNLPETNFSCQGKVIGGYYADVEAGCQMFHVCTIGQKDEIMDIKFLCLNGTVFDQETRVCERVDEVDCSKSERFYNLNLELYGNNAVTLSLHEEEDDDASTESRDEQQQQQHHHMTSAHPSTTTTTTTTTPRPTSPPTTSTSIYSQQQPTGYPQHYQPRPAFIPHQTSQSNTRYDDKNGGYHHQYIFHNDERSNNNQATSYQLFSNQGPSSTTPTPQNHQQVRYATTNPNGVHGETSTTMPLQYHVQSTPQPVQTLLNNNGNSPSLINPLFHNHGIASTTENFNNHNTNPREIAEYEDESEEELEDEIDETGPPDSLQSTNKGKVSKLTLSSAPHQDSHSMLIQTRNNQSLQHPKLSLNYLPTSNPTQTTVRALYPTQRPAPALQKPQKFQLKNQMSQHTHIPPSQSISQAKPHQITINLPPSDVHRIVQNPSPLLPSQSRVIVTAKASVSDESGRPLNASQLITLPLATLPSNYDDYKEGEESFDPFYRDVPKIRNDQRIIVSRRIETSGLISRKKRSADIASDGRDSSGEVIFNAEIKDIKDLKANLPIIKAILFGLPIPENEESLLDPGSVDFEDPQTYESIEETFEIPNKSVPTKPRIPSSTSDDVNRDHHDELQPEVIIGKSGIRPTEGPFVAQSHQTDTPEPGSTVRLFLHTNEDISSSTTKPDSFSQVQILNSTNQILNANETNSINRELLQLQTPSTPRGSTRRRNRYRQRYRESADYSPRRPSQMGRPKPPRYYDEYGASESIEISSKQRANRYRSNERPITKYEYDYIEEDGTRDYDEGYLYRTRSHERGPQGRRVPIRNRNRPLDYEDDVEVHEKPDSLIKTGDLREHRVNAHPARYGEDTRLRSSSERGTKRRRQKITNATPDHEIQTKSEIAIGNLTGLTSIPPKLLDEEYAKHHSNNGSHEPSRTFAEESFTKDGESVGKHVELKEDYPIDDNTSSEGYDVKSERKEFADDYSDYSLPRYQTGRERPSSRNNRNRSRGGSPKPRRGSRRRNKSPITINAAGNRQNTDDTTEATFKDLTTIKYDVDTRATNLPTKTRDPEELTNTEEYDEHGLTESSLPVDNTEISGTKSQELNGQDVETEGVLIFTDEIVQSTSTQNSLENDGPIAIDEEDYVDDNYEAAIHESSEDDQPIIPLTNLEDRDSKRKGEKSETGNKYEKENLTPLEKQNEKDEKIPHENILKNASDPSSPKRYDNRGTTSFPSSSSLPQYSSPTSVVTSSEVGSTAEDITTMPISIESLGQNTTPTTRYITYPSPSLTSLTTLRSRASTKFVKPTVSRKNYSHSAPTTTPNSVTIRHSSLAGPKPTKPSPTYTDLASKPLIRRLPLLSRTTTTTSEASILEDEISAKLTKQFEKEASKHPSAIKGSNSAQQTPAVITNTPTNDGSTPSKSSILSKAPSSIASNNEKNHLRNEIGTTLDTSNITQNHSKGQISDNEVPKYTALVTETNEVPQNTYALNNSLLKSRIQSTTSNNSSETSVEKADESAKVSKSQTTTQRSPKPSERRKLELTSVKSQLLKNSQDSKQLAGFNCLEKEMYRFYGDARDCRLFHYCSPGFTTRQVLDFRFVCEEGTIFDENSQSCLHDVPNPKCVKRNW